MDFMSFLLGGMFAAEVLDEYDRQEAEYDMYEDYLYEMEQERERLQDLLTLEHSFEDDFDFDDDDEI